MIQLKFALAQWIKHSWASCKAIIKLLIKPQISYFIFQGREANLLPCEQRDIDKSFLIYVCLRSFNSMPVMALQAHVLTSFCHDKKTRDEAKILNMIKIFMYGCQRQNCEVRLKENVVKVTIFSTQLFNRWGNWDTQKSSNIPRAMKLFNEKLRTYS